MFGFEVPLSIQLANVLNGRTADGSGRSPYRSLPSFEAESDLCNILAETTAWTFYGLADDLRAREDVRTVVIRMAAAHLLRLYRQRYKLMKAADEMEWMSRAIAANPAFLATTLAAKQGIPELPALYPELNRNAVRARTLNAYFELKSKSRVNDHIPERTAVTHRYTVYRHRTPHDLQDFSAVAVRWRAHIKAIFRNAEPNHRYWAQVAKGERMLFTFVSGGIRKASIDMHLGNITALDLHEPVQETTYELLATALAHLGTVLKLPCESPNTVIQKLLATQGKTLRAADSPNPTPDTAETLRGLSQRATPPPVEARKPTCTMSTDKLLAIAVLVVALAYLIPVSMLAALGVSQNGAAPCPNTAPSRLPIPPRTGATP